MAADPASVRLLRGEVLRWFHEQRLGDDQLAASIALATSEAVGNVVRHAYGREGGRVEVEAGRSDDEIVIVVSDRGLGFAVSHGTRTGLGLPVIRRVSSGVTVACDAQGTTVRMRFELPHAALNRPARRRAEARPTLALGAR